MHIHYSENVQANDDLFAFARQLNETFEEIVQGHGDDLQVNWDGAASHEKRKVDGELEMKLFDAGSPQSYITQFPLRLRENPQAARTLALRAWGDILQRRSHSLLERLQRDD